MPLATKNGSLIIQSGRIVESCACCTCDCVQGFVAFDGSGRRFRFAKLIDADTCYFTPVAQRHTDGTDGYYVVEAQRLCGLGKNAGVITESYGGYLSLGYAPIGGRSSSVPTTHQNNSPANSATFTSIIMDANCNNSTGEKIGWLLFDELPPATKPTSDDCTTGCCFETIATGGGACCVVPKCQCVGTNQKFLAGGTCATGACCDTAYIDSAGQPRCTVVPECNCIGPTKTFKGAGTTCSGTAPCCPTGMCCGGDYINVSGGTTRNVCRTTTEADCIARGGRYIPCLTCDPLLVEGGVNYCVRSCYCDDGTTFRPSSVTVVINNKREAGRTLTDPYHGYNWNGTYVVDTSRQINCEFAWNKYDVPVPASLQPIIGPTCLLILRWGLQTNLRYSSFVFGLYANNNQWAGGDTDYGGSNIPLSEQRAALCNGQVITNLLLNTDNGLPTFTIFSNGSNPLP
jgi:hypothetical protein